MKFVDLRICTIFVATNLIIAGSAYAQVAQPSGRALPANVQFHTCAAGYAGPNRQLDKPGPSIGYACIRNSDRLVGTPTCEAPLFATAVTRDPNNHNKQTYRCIPKP